MPFYILELAKKLYAALLLVNYPVFYGVEPLF